mmetsp:Transcript_66786/g.134641  ORF Transcript_66786/g.134641 Transcript_66786/m.134641 type:complete len:272 (-) Transcript_66786:361-1176(-)
MASGGRSIGAGAGKVGEEEEGVEEVPSSVPPAARLNPSSGADRGSSLKPPTPPPPQPPETPASSWPLPPEPPPPSPQPCEAVVAMGVANRLRPNTACLLSPSKLLRTSRSAPCAAATSACVRPNLLPSASALLSASAASKRTDSARAFALASSAAKLCKLSPNCRLRWSLSDCRAASDCFVAASAWWRRASSASADRLLTVSCSASDRRVVRAVPSKCSAFSVACCTLSMASLHFSSASCIRAAHCSDSPSAAATFACASAPRRSQSSHLR